MDMREARRAAERAARERVASRVKAVGELGVLAKRREQAQIGVAAAQERAAAIVEAARVAGERLVRTAEEQTSQIDEVYEAAYANALSCGWGVDELHGIGFASASETTSSQSPPTAADHKREVDDAHAAAAADGTGSSSADRRAGRRGT